MNSKTQALGRAIDDARRGHRPSEWERVAYDLATAAEQFLHTKSLKDMQDEVTAWCERKGWRGEGSAPVTFGDTMALLHSEVSEALEAFRDWGTADATKDEWTTCTDPQCGDSTWDHDCDVRRIPGKPEGIGSEFADVLIRLLDDCDRWGVDLTFEYERKMAYNEKRPYQHGGRAL